MALDLTLDLGADVVTLQNALIAAGVTVPGGADGVFGSATKSALTAYQSRSGLATTGTVDEATAAALGLTTPAPAATSASGLTVGAQGDEVKALQTALMAFGVFVPGGADGVRASTRWMMFSLMSCSPKLMKIFVPVIR